MANGSSAIPAPPAARRPPADLLADHMAGQLVQAMQQISGVTLDYTPDSIAHVDRLLGSFHRDGVEAGRVRHLLFQAGCYVGQVFVKHRPGFRWRHPDEVSPPLEPEMFPFPVVAQVGPHGTLWAPINKAHAVLHDPEANSLLFSYQGWSAGDGAGAVAGADARPEPA